MSAAIELDALSKRYYLGKGKRELWALRDVTLSVPRGTLVGVIGPNGAGKTTLLKILSRVTPPTSGRATIAGRVVSLLEVGAAFQAELSARENVFLNAAMFGISRAEVAGKLEEIASFADVADRLDEPVKRLSSGTYLRLAFSVAINLEPDVLLADEVLAVGDAVFQERSLQRVEEDGRRGLTVLFVSHDMEAVRRLCGRTIWLDGGRIVDDGETEEVTERYERSAWSRVGEKTNRDRSALGELIDARLTSPSGDELGAVRTFDDVDVRITFQTAVPDVDVRCALVVRTGGVVAFRSAPTELARIEQPGEYEVTARLPARLLADHPYSIKVGVELRRGEEAVIVARENAISFRVFDVEPPPALWPSGAEGVLRPALRWSAPVPSPRTAAVETP